MIDKEEGRRCWTLLYRDNADNPKEKYHMDILPCVSNSMYNDIFVRLSREAYSRESVEQIAIRITDKKTEGYATETNEANWLKSNPDGYALWFASRCKQTTQLRETKVEDIIPIGKYTENKTTFKSNDIRFKITGKEGSSLFTAFVMIGGSLILAEFGYMAYVYFCGNPFM